MCIYSGYNRQLILPVQKHENTKQNYETAGYDANKNNFLL